MDGRYGVDALGQFLSILGCVCFLLFLLARWGKNAVLANLLVSAAVFLLVWCYCRFLSRNIPRRQAENQKFLDLKHKITGWFRLKWDCFRLRKEYAFFKCPGCGRTVRVPRGKGKLRITCRSCGYSFEGKS